MADFATRYFHMQRFTPVDAAVAAAPDAWIVLHQGNQLNPYINYPFLTVEPLRRYNLSLTRTRTLTVTLALALTLTLTITADAQVRGGGARQGRQGEALLHGARALDLRPGDLGAPLARRRGARALPRPGQG